MQLFLLMACLGAGSLAQAEGVGAPHEKGGEEAITYIGTNEYPAQHVAAAAKAGVVLRAYNLDAPRDLENHLAANLPVDDMPAAEALVQERFNALSAEEVRDVFQAVMLAAQWDIRKTPAFVCGDGDAVIYGLTDAGEAIDHCRAWRRRMRP